MCHNPFRNDESHKRWVILIKWFCKKHLHVFMIPSVHWGINRQHVALFFFQQYLLSKSYSTPQPHHKLHLSSVWLLLDPLPRHMLKHCIFYVVEHSLTHWHYFLDFFCFSNTLCSIAYTYISNYISKLQWLLTSIHNKSTPLVVLNYQLLVFKKGQYLCLPRLTEDQF